MSTYEELSLIVSIALLTVAVLNLKNRRSAATIPRMLRILIGMFYTAA